VNEHRDEGDDFVETRPEDLVSSAWPALLQPHVLRSNDGRIDVWGYCGQSPVILLRAATETDAVAIMTQMIDGRSRISSAFRAGVAIGKASAALKVKSCE
jgi:hypothetical protein